MQRGPQHSRKFQLKLNTGQTKHQVMHFLSTYLQVVIQSKISGRMLPERDKNTHDNLKEQDADIQQHNWHLPHIHRNNSSSLARVTSISDSKSTELTRYKAIACWVADVTQVRDMMSEANQILRSVHEPSLTESQRVLFVMTPDINSPLGKNARSAKLISSEGRTDRNSR